MNLNRKHFTELFRADYKTVAVTFESTGAHCRSYNKKYVYKVPKDLGVANGDKLVVYVDHREHGTGLQIVTVAEVHENPEINSAASFNYKWIVGRFDDIMASQALNIAKDNKLKLAVEKLEVALTRVSLRKQLASAMEELDADTVNELSLLFGQDLRQAAIEK